MSACNSPNCQCCNEEADEAQSVRLSAERALAALPVKSAKPECTASESGRHESDCDGWYCDWCSEEMPSPVPQGDPK